MTKGQYERTEAHRAVMSAAMKGTPRSADHRAKLRAAMRREEVGYWAIHTRLRVERGPAKEYACANNCGRQAMSWAYKEPHGFSADLEDYRPLCWPCHTQQDRSGEEA